jgi:hypothetical protein
MGELNRIEESIERNDKFSLLLPGISHYLRKGQWKRCRDIASIKTDAIQYLTYIESEFQILVATPHHIASTFLVNPILS